jgi:hypothetical protein
MLIGGVIDLGRALTSYVSLVRTAYEGGRFAATVKTLSPGCYGYGCGSEDGSIATIHQRMRNLLIARGFSVDDISNTKLTTTITKIDEASTSYVTVQSRVEVPFRSLMRFLSLASLSTTVTSPHLFPDADA